MKATIYALVDPNTNQVRYVGRTTQTAPRRLAHHIGEAKRGKNPHPVYAWIRTLQPGIPVLVILQEGVPVQTMGPHAGDPAYSIAQAAETKWMKRFERSQLLCEIPRRSQTYITLVNPPNVKASKKVLG